ncbi:MAG: RNA polymerase subunit sigma [Alphaproteobacteria bacterium]|nr:MAG: RNA polymerase subunit sigma [Alphaproteobacteria bacterium]
MSSKPVPPPVAEDGAIAPAGGLSPLMVQVTAGDVVAFNQLARALQGPGLRLADRTLNDRAAAEDVVQVALTRLWTLAERYDPARGSVEGWFRRIVVNLCLDRRRSLKLVVPLEAAEHVASSEPDPYQVAVASDQRRRLDAAMAHLAPRQRAALAMFHGEGMSMAEIALLIDATPKAVEGLLGRARMELRNLLGMDKQP